MLRSLRSVLLRVDRLADAQGKESAADIQEQLEAILVAGRQRVAQAKQTGEELLQSSYEEVRARGRELRAELRAAGLIR